MTYKKLLELIEEMNDEEKEQKVVALIDDTFHDITTTLVVNYVDEGCPVEVGQMVLT